MKGFRNHYEPEEDVSLKINKRHAFSVFVLALVCCLVFSFSVIGLIERNRQMTERTQMEYLALIKSSKINETIISLLYKAESLMMLVIQGNGEVKDFERIASTIIVDNPVIRNVLLAPGGVVTHAYPLDSNEKLMGFDMFSNMPGNAEARLARDSGRLTLGGPFTAVQGGEIIVGRMPVFLNETSATKTLWGLVSVTLNYPDVLSAVNMDDLTQAGYLCEIWRINPDTNERQIILKSTEQDFESMPVERPFTIMNAQWNIGLTPAIKWYERTPLYYNIMVMALLSFLIATICRAYSTMKQMKSAMEHIAMTDSLTQIANRRHAFIEFGKEISKHKAKKTFFAVIVFELNHFKQINDIYGHSIGDAVLAETGARLKQITGSNNLAARIGGDEFLIILRNIDGIDLNDLRDNAEEKLSQSMQLSDYEKVDLSVCSGIAVYPADGHTLENMILFAERDLYSEKARMNCKKD